MGEMGKGWWTHLYLNSPSLPHKKLAHKTPPGIPHFFFLTSLGWFHWQTHFWFLESCHRHWVNGRGCWSFKDNRVFPISISSNFFSMVPVTWLIFHGWVHQHVFKLPLQLLFASIPHNLGATNRVGTQKKAVQMKEKYPSGTGSLIWLFLPTKAAFNKFNLVTTVNINCNVQMLTSTDYILPALTNQQAQSRNFLALDKVRLLLN